MAPLSSSSSCLVLSRSSSISLRSPKSWVSSAWPSTRLKNSAALQTSTSPFSASSQRVDFLPRYLDAMTLVALLTRRLLEAFSA